MITMSNKMPWEMRQSTESVVGIVILAIGLALAAAALVPLAFP